jgi:tRNA-specific adenosine deaminase 2
LDVYVTCEPCIMCASMLGQLPFARVKVIFGCANDKFGGGGTCLSVHEMRGLPSCLQSDTADDGSFSSSKAHECVGGLFKDEAVELFQRFYVRGNPKAPSPHREVREYPS